MNSAFPGDGDGDGDNDALVTGRREFGICSNPLARQPLLMSAARGRRIRRLLGLDHEALTFRHAGRDYRLTDVHGEVVKPILT